ncbi:hypothetical protein F4678DRAFT_482001 [Xylaria arbuscula]|nr:hypothetical protein F4678DRAFT_482001 [Xylaria arbuscula]
MLNAIFMRRPMQGHRVQRPRLQGPRMQHHETCVVTIKLSATMITKLKAMLHREPTFHSFSKLPAELRVMIWKCAAYTQDRVVAMRPHANLAGEYRGFQTMVAPMPPIFLVNQEAYAETRKLYVHLAPEFHPDSEPTPTGPLISFENDIFHFPEDERPIFGDGRTSYPAFSTIRNNWQIKFGSFLEVCLSKSRKRDRKPVPRDDEPSPLRPFCRIGTRPWNMSLLTATEMEAHKPTNVDWLQAIDGHGLHVSFTRGDLDALSFGFERWLERYYRMNRDAWKHAVVGPPLLWSREHRRAEVVRWRLGLQQLLDDHNFHWYYQQKGIHLPQFMFDGNGWVVKTSSKQ